MTISQQYLRKLVALVVVDRVDVVGELLGVHVPLWGATFVVRSEGVTNMAVDHALPGAWCLLRSGRPRGGRRRRRHECRRGYRRGHCLRHGGRWILVHEEQEDGHHGEADHYGSPQLLVSVGRVDRSSAEREADDEREHHRAPPKEGFAKGIVRGKERNGVPLCDFRARSPLVSVPALMASIQS